MTATPPAGGPIVAAVGASAGGVQELTRFVAALPAESDLAVLVVLHLSPRSPSVLAQILQRQTSWPVAVPQEGVAVQRGHVYVAPPDQHMVLLDGHVHLNREPRENGHRPALDTTLRSVAHAYGARSACVVLSGLNDDGALGAREIKAAGGRVLVQHPDESLYDRMPRSTIDATPVDLIATVPELAAAVVAFAAQENHAVHATEPLEPLVAVAETNGLSCPDCGGVLTREVSGEVESYVCRIGHRYGPDSLETEQRRQLEIALWAAVRGLEERAELLRRLARRNHDRGHVPTGAQYELEAAQAVEQAGQIRAIIAGAPPADGEAA